MKTVFKRTETLYDNPTHYCPGCGHGVVHRLVAEALVELGLRGRAIGIAPVGCSVLIYNYLIFQPIYSFFLRLSHLFLSVLYLYQHLFVVVNSNSIYNQFPAFFIFSLASFINMYIVSIR